MKKNNRNGQPIYKTTIRIKDPVLQEILEKTYEKIPGVSLNDFFLGIIEDGLRYEKIKEGQERMDFSTAVEEIKTRIDERNTSLLKDLSDVVAVRLSESKDGGLDPEKSFKLECAIYNLLLALMRGMTLTRSQVDSGELSAIPRWLNKKD